MSLARRDPARATWRAWLQDRAAEVGDRQALRDLAALLEAQVRGHDRAPQLTDPVGLPSGFDAADLMAAARPWLLAGDDRRAAGAVYTPPGVVAGVLAQAVADWSVPPKPLVCDPACGGGAFLVAAARWLHGRGLDAATIVGDLLWGVDVDALAVESAIDSVRLWALDTDGCDVRPPHLVVADPLRSGSAAWPQEPGFDLVIGNPPFQGQLGRRTARSRRDAAELAVQLGSSVSGYADTAALFLVLARRLAGPRDGRVSLVLPESILGARDAGPARAAATEGANLVGLWVATEPVFEASTKVCAPVLQIGPPATGEAEGQWVQRSRGVDFEAVAPGRLGDTGSWSRLALAAYRTPEVRLRGAPDGGCLADLATATAGFRDQFYGLAPFVHEGDGGAAGRPSLVTSGLIDPGGHRWGRSPARFAGRSWLAPVVDAERLAVADPVLSRWVTARLVPKVLVATQTRVIEAVVDLGANLVPSVPVLSVEPFDPADLWRVAAVLSAPTTSAWALAEAGGTALAGDTIKLSAAQVLRIPLPAVSGAWGRGARRLEVADAAGEAVDWSAFGSEMVTAYGVPAGHQVCAWWLERLTRAVSRSTEGHVSR